MKRGDMAQLDEDRRIDIRLRQTVALSAMILMLLLATLIGVFLGFMIWGI